MTHDIKHDDAVSNLTRRQLRFVECYLSGMNQTDAAKEAGYKHPTKQGYHLLNMPKYEKIQRAVEKGREEARA
ncbi:MAG: terminase small subunit [Arenicellales bacterium]|nr:terminase small subunit [Arenicellales bacterium]